VIHSDILLVISFWGRFLPRLSPASAGPIFLGHHRNGDRAVAVGTIRVFPQLVAYRTKWAGKPYECFIGSQPDEPCCRKTATKPAKRERPECLSSCPPMKTPRSTNFSGGPECRKAAAVRDAKARAGFGQNIALIVSALNCAATAAHAPRRRAVVMPYLSQIFDGISLTSPWEGDG
jgi:hypothetical protein